MHLSLSLYAHMSTSQETLITALKSDYNGKVSRSGRPEFVLPAPLAVAVASGPFRHPPSARAHPGFFFRGAEDAQSSFA